MGEHESGTALAGYWPEATNGQSQILRLEVEPVFRPAWYRVDYPAHIPIPSSPSPTPAGDVILWGWAGEQKIALVSVSAEGVHLRFDWERWRRFILEEEYRDLARPLYTRLPVHYHIVPAPIRNFLLERMYAGDGRTSITRREWPGFPIEQGFELLQAIYLYLIGSPPGDRSSTIVLTHDVDTAEGLKWVKPIAKIEMEMGFRSLWNVVGKKYTHDYSILDWLAANGFEVGLHGYNHDNKLIFLSETEIRRRLDACRPLIEAYQIQSFRSPSWFRSQKLYRILADYVRFDYSSLDTDVVCPGGVGGCLSTHPFEYFGLTHIPTTLPFEAPVFYGHDSADLASFWRPKLRWLRESQGDVVVITHPDPHYLGNPTMMAAYEQLLWLLAEANW